MVKHLYQSDDGLSNSFRKNRLLDTIMDFKSNEKILLKMSELYGLAFAICKDILLRSFLLLHGIATMICVNHMEFSNQEIASMMKQSVADMVQGAKGAKE